MKHAEPKIQELVEQLQGALDTLSCHQVRWMWRVDETLSGTYHISGTAVWLKSPSFVDPPIDESRRLYFTFAVNLRSLHEKYWDDLKYNLVQQCVLCIIKNAKPASEHEVTYFTE